MKFNKRAWERGVRQFGKPKMVFGLVTAPIWMPVWCVLALIAAVLLILGAAGEMLARRLGL
jgi:hypothetical protein